MTTLKLAVFGSELAVLAETLSYPLSSACFSSFFICNLPALNPNISCMFLVFQLFWRGQWVTPRLSAACELRFPPKKQMVNKLRRQRDAIWGQDLRCKDYSQSVHINQAEGRDHIIWRPHQIWLRRKRQWTQVWIQVHIQADVEEENHIAGSLFHSLALLSRGVTWSQWR